MFGKILMDALGESIEEMIDGGHFEKKEIPMTKQEKKHWRAIVQLKENMVDMMKTVEKKKKILVALAEDRQEEDGFMIIKFDEKEPRFIAIKHSEEGKEEHKEENKCRCPKGKH